MVNWNLISSEFGYIVTLLITLKYVRTTAVALEREGGRLGV